MVGNNIYDPKSGKVFGFGPDDDPQNVDPMWYKDHIPLYTSAAAQGQPFCPNCNTSVAVANRSKQTSAKSPLSP
jgi:hypothetical protein